MADAGLAGSAHSQSWLRVSGPIERGKSVVEPGKASEKPNTGTETADKQSGGVEMGIKEQIGETAGRVWQLLDTEGPQTLGQVKKRLNVKNEMVEYALGWLAREEKVEFVPEKRTYRIHLK